MQRLVKEAPKNTWAHYYAASLFFIQNRLDWRCRPRGMRSPSTLRMRRPRTCWAPAWPRWGKTTRPVTAFETSIKADPKEPGTYANLATLELQTANRDRALKYFAEALTIDPNHQAARDGLATIRSQ